MISLKELVEMMVLLGLGFNLSGWLQSDLLALGEELGEVVEDRSWVRRLIGLIEA